MTMIMIITKGQENNVSVVHVASLGERTVKAIEKTLDSMYRYVSSLRLSMQGFIFVVYQCIVPNSFKAYCALSFSS